MSEQPVSDRIKILFEHFGNGNVSAFARSISVHQQTVRDLIKGEKGGPSWPVLQNILAEYPAIRLEWLLLGEGEMLKNAAPLKNNVVSSPPQPAGGKVIQLDIAPDTSGNLPAHLINYKAAANYLAGYQSQEYYEELATVTLPPTLAKGVLKAFYVTGDSMEPTFYADDIAICHQISRADWRHLGAETVAVVVSNSHGLQLKRVTVRPSIGQLRCDSDNPRSPHFHLNIDDDVLEIWPFDWLLTKRCEKANSDLPEWRRHIENEIGDMRYLLEQHIERTQPPKPTPPTA